MLIEANIDGELNFNWNSLPDEIKKRTDLKDKIFKQLQEEFQVGDPLSSKIIYQINRRAMELLKTYFN